MISKNKMFLDKIWCTGICNLFDVIAFGMIFN